VSEDTPFGFGSREWLGDTPLEADPPTVPNAEAAVALRAAVEGRPFVRRVTHGNGSQVVVEVNPAAISIEPGIPEGEKESAWRAYEATMELLEDARAKGLRPAGRPDTSSRSAGARLTFEVVDG